MGSSWRRGTSSSGRLDDGAREKAMQTNRIVILLLVVLSISGCATLSKITGSIGPEYKQDKVDEFHAKTKELHSKLKSIGDKIAELRNRVGAVVKGDISYDKIKEDVNKLKGMVATVKEIPKKVKDLVMTAKQMLMEAPQKYAGPQALHLPKKVKLIKKSIAVLKEIPSVCKGIAMEGVALTKCVGGLASGSAAQCDEKSLVAKADPTSTTATSDSGTGTDAKGEAASGGIVPTLGKGLTKPKTGKAKLPGGLLIKSAPTGAHVKLDGRKQMGKTPLTIGNLKPGKHVVQLQKGILKFRGTAVVVSDKYSTVTLTLVKPKGRLDIQSRPAEASIFLDGKEVGKTPRIIRDVEAGEHEIVLQSKGYIPMKKRVRLGVKKLRKLVRIKLRRAGEIRVTSTPNGAVVFIDGKKSGQTPLDLSIAPGRRHIKVELSGHSAVTQKVRVEAGKKAEVAVRLEMTEEEKQRRAALAAKKRAAEEARRRAALEAKKRAEVLAKKRAEELAKKRAEEEKRRREEEKRRVAAESAYKKKLLAYESTMAPVRKKRRRKSILAFSLLGGGVALAAASGILLGLGKQQGDEAHAKYTAVANFNQSDIDKHREHIESGRTKMIVGGVLAGVATAAIGYSIFAFISRPNVEERPKRNGPLSAFRVSPMVQNVGIVVSSQF